MLIFKLNNNILVNFLLLFLTNFCNNLILIILLFNLIFLIFFNKLLLLPPYIYLFLVKFKVGFFINIPLSNSLFFIHPILLITNWVLVIFYIWGGKIKYLNFNHYLVFFISLFLGGYWSIQEFNWGGWWNWDILELFSFLTVLNFLIFSHIVRLKKNIFLNKIQYLILAILIIYFTFNKLGINSSIHTFIKSKNFSNNIIINIIIFFYFIYFLKKEAIFILYVIFVVLIFFNVQVLYFFKFIFIYIYLYKLFLRKKLIKKINNIMHFLVFLFFINILVLSNFFNSSFIWFDKNYPKINYLYFFEKKILVKIIYSNYSSLHLFTNFWFTKLINLVINGNWYFISNKLFNFNFSFFNFFKFF